MSIVASIWIQNARLYSESGNCVPENAEKETPGERPGPKSAGGRSDREQQASREDPAPRNMNMAALKERIEKALPLQA
jgi:hypothetical protein